MACLAKKVSMCIDIALFMQQLLYIGIEWKWGQGHLFVFSWNDQVEWDRRDNLVGFGDVARIIRAVAGNRHIWVMAEEKYSDSPPPESH